MISKGQKQQGLGENRAKSDPAAVTPLPAKADLTRSDKIRDEIASATFVPTHFSYVGRYSITIWSVLNALLLGKSYNAPGSPSPSPFIEKAATVYHLRQVRVRLPGKRRKLRRRL